MKGHFIARCHIEVFLLIPIDQSYLEKVGNATGNIETRQVNEYALLCIER